MQGIFNAIKTFIEFCFSIIRFAIKLIKDLAYTVDMISLTILKVPTYLNFLPTVVLSMFAITLSVVIIYKVLGRD